jgi:hypothetical protein
VFTQSRQYATGVPFVLVPLLIICMIYAIDFARLLLCFRKSSKAELLDKMARCSQIENYKQGDVCGVGALSTFHED